LQKRSHIHLARALAHAAPGFDRRRHRAAFLLGSVQPDCNPLTYLKGSRSAGCFQGHSFAGARPYLFNRMAHLKQRRRWSLRHYYTLGKLTHYLADAFTAPHNSAFSGGPAAHHRYESELRRHLTAALAHPQCILPPVRGCPLPAAAVDALHRQYLSGEPHIQRDIDYILRATALLMASCAPAAPQFPSYNTHRG